LATLWYLSQYACRSCAGAHIRTLQQTCIQLYSRRNDGPALRHLGITASEPFVGRAQLAKLDTAYSQRGGIGGFYSHAEILLHAKFSGLEERDLGADIQPLASLGQASMVFPLTDTYLDTEHDRYMVSISLVHDTLHSAGKSH